MRMTKPLGCFSFSGIIAAVATLLAIIGFTLFGGGVVFSPGALNAQEGDKLGGVNSHAELGSECGACHAAPWSQDSMANLCFDCHTNVKKDLEDPKSLHGLLKERQGTLVCINCHTDHNGIIANLTTFNTNIDFSHQEATKFSLKAHEEYDDNGEKKSLVCADCHTKNLDVFEVAVCDTCHRNIDEKFTQAHVEVFGQGCLDCHDGVDRYDDFDHDLTDYPLKDKHVTDCIGCHMGDFTVTDLNATPIKCYACHQKDDVHLEQYGRDCKACHTVVDWEEKPFDHSKTNFPLEGVHDVQNIPECEACHTNNAFKATPTDCVSCHQKNDIHLGQLGTDCAKCHSAPSKWVDTIDKAFNHDDTNYPLEAGHKLVEKCEDCHINDIFLGTPQDCNACHQKDDEHKGEYGLDCVTCHTLEKWDDIPFDHDTQTNYPLEGGHKDVEKCQDCHTTPILDGTPLGCNDCHEKNDVHEGNFSPECVACHTAVKWTDIIFDHAQSKLPLTEGHDGLTCEACHYNNLFTDTPLECAACHIEPIIHIGLFPDTACEECHIAAAWIPVSKFELTHDFPFDHGTPGQPNDCIDCHTTSLTIYSCYSGCHEHSQSSIEPWHQREGIYDFQNCAKCHPEGRARKR